MMEYCTCGKKNDRVNYYNGIRVCCFCEKTFKTKICKVSNIKPKQVGYIHQASMSKEVDSIIGQFFVLIDKKDGVYGILLNGKRQIVNQEWAEDHYICESRKAMDLEYEETHDYDPMGLEMGYSLRRYENAYWDNTPSINLEFDKLEEGDGGYLSLHTGGVWSCGVPYGEYLEMRKYQHGQDAYGYHRPFEAVGPVLVCATKHDAFNLNYIVNKKDAQP